jgi:hypothetical protein
MKKVVEVELTDAQRDPLLGHYESNIGKIYISQDNGKLYVQFDGGQKQELGASSETTLYSKQEAIQFSFGKGPGGKVESAQVEQIGRTYKMTKIDQLLR